MMRARSLRQSVEEGASLEEAAAPLGAEVVGVKPFSLREGPGDEAPMALQFLGRNLVSMNPGELSEPMMTPEGAALLKVVAREAGPDELVELGRRIARQGLRWQRLQALATSWQDYLVEKHGAHPIDYTEEDAAQDDEAESTDA